MQWYREKRLMVDGVRYLSCTASDRFPNKGFNKFNYVIPVQECNETGLCNSLLINFSSSKVYSYIKPENGKPIDTLIHEISNSLNSQNFSVLR